MKKLNWVDFYLLNVNKSLVSQLKPVTSTDTFQGLTKNFHPEGLYSTDIFGLTGSEARDSTFSYIDIKLDIISPTVCLAMFQLKQLYEEICSGKRFATWNEKEKDFEPALPSEKGADTGFNFFLSHYTELDPSRNDSLRRDESVDFFNKFRPVSLSRYVLVLPAGLRDLVVRPDGRDQEDDIGGLYRRLVSLSRAIPDRNARTELTDPVRWKLQQTFNEIWMYFFNIQDGKGGFARRKVTSRKLLNGTRNVLSSFSTGSKVMGREDAVRPTDTRIGLYQTLKALLPVAQYNIRERYLSNIRAGDGNLYGVNTKTLKREFLEVPGRVYDLYATDDGIELLINRMEARELRHQPMMIDKDHYVALIYQDKKHFKVFYDIEELPEGFSRKLVRGISLAELLYLSGYDLWNDYFSFITRYPVTGRGSTYSSTIRLETTTSSLYLKELEDDWVTVKAKGATSFPDRNVPTFVESMAPHPSRLGGLGGDYDGDTGSANSPMSQEALEENRKWVNSKNYWFATDGSFKVQPVNNVIKRATQALLK
ncbi:putative DNA-directed RNA polymerase beta subunit [Erwinia phage vB_EamM_Stratton]|uniref:Putative DNA-directed RNA polymerase beta subunit n=2 Tax=Erskinevirus EaH2 TaxID=2169883 RepID=A0A1B2IHE0_9CAUD|nr:RNA polymerase beta subunit [Erwinia phage phiEaH2]AFQ96705.1 putative phage DNA-directed RNA polymerase beta subunit [Erwinia phage phiEaH2]ANZ50687.1 putative DNA-directed RNA polymerase beta subunit [Erwinia phage vB_EamM_Stratton]